MAPIPPRLVKKDDSLKYLKTEILKLTQSYESLYQLLKKDTWYNSQTYVRIDENWTEEQINGLIDVEVGPLEDDIENIQRQVDGQIETWFYNGEPGPLVLPESEWVAIDTQAGNNNERLKHLGDLYYDNSTGYAYRYSNSGTEQSPVFYWKPISDSAVIEALSQASQAQDTADHKRRIFVTANGVLPTPPYSEGDMWINAIYPSQNTEKDWANGKYYNDILRCNVPATYSGDKLVREGVETGEEASISHWSPSSNYTDDTYAHSFDYFKTAMQSGGTQLLGGLILSKTIALRDQNDNIMAGVNGILQSGTPLESIAAWFGGPMVDHEKNPSAQDYAKILFRMNGSGYLAGGLISFDANGALTTVDLRTATTYLGTIKLGDIYISPDANNNYLEIYKLDANNNKIAAGLCAYGGLSALGQGVSGGGGGGSEMLGDLIDVAISSPTNGQALVYNSTTGKWENGTIISGVQSNWAETDPTSLAYIQNKPKVPTASSTNAGYAANADYAVSAGSATKLSGLGTITYGQNSLQYCDKYDTEASNPANAIGNPSGDWYHHIVMNHANSGGYFVDMTICFHSDKFYYRRIANGVASNWVRVLDSSNSSVSKSGSTLTVKINGSSESITDTNTWRPLGTGASDACAGNDSRLSDSRPASDVYSWAKQSTKPSYNLDEVSDGSTRKLSNYLPLSGGTMTGAITFCNNTWNSVGDDCAMGDHNIAGGFAICGLNGNTRLDFCQFGTPSNYQSIIYDGSKLSTTGGFQIAQVEIGHTNEINSLSGMLHLNYRINTDVSICNGGGNVGIGTASPVCKLHVVGSINATAGLSCLTQSSASDIRMKNVIDEDVLPTLSEVANAPAIRFTWKHAPELGNQVGSVAQYWQGVLPETVNKTPENKLSFQYGVAALLSSITNAREIERLWQHVSELEKRSNN